MIKEQHKEKFLEYYEMYMLWQAKASFATGKQKEMYELASVANLLSVLEIKDQIQEYSPEKITQEQNFFDNFSKMKLYDFLKNRPKEIASQEEILSKLDFLMEENKNLKEKLNSIEDATKRY